MIPENQRAKGIALSRVIAGIIAGMVFFVVVSAEVLAGIKIVNPSHGVARIKGETVGYYYYGAKIAADTKTSLLFKQGQCSIIDKNGRKYSKCWIHIAGGSAGLSVSQQAPIRMKTLGVGLDGRGSSSVVQWNTLMVGGKDGAIEFGIPKGGYVVLNFLWEVPAGFSPSRMNIADVIKMPLK